MDKEGRIVATVSRIAPEHRALQAPEPMRELQGWLTWRYEQFPNEAKPRKVPYYADGGKRYGLQGSPNDRAKLTTFAAARDAAARRGHDGVGIALLSDWGITALDFDKCVDASGNIPAEIAKAKRLAMSMVLRRLVPTGSVRSPITCCQSANC